MRALALPERILRSELSPPRRLTPLHTMYARKCPMLLTILAILLLTDTSHARAKIKISLYPKNSLPCLNKSADLAGCNGDTEQAMNSCLCSNGGDFVTNTASCVGRQAPGDVSAVYSAMQSACSSSNSPLRVQRAVFFSAAGPRSITSSISLSLPSTTPSSGGTGAPILPGSTTTAAATKSMDTTNIGRTSAASQAETGASTGTGRPTADFDGKARAAAIAGATCGGLLLTIAAVFFLVRHRKKRENPGSQSVALDKGAGLFGGWLSKTRVLRTTGEMPTPKLAHRAHSLLRGPRWRPTAKPNHSPMPGGINWKMVPSDAVRSAEWGKTRAPEGQVERGARALQAVLSAALPTAPDRHSVVDPPQLFELEGPQRPVEIAGRPIHVKYVLPRFAEDDSEPTLGYHQ